MKFDRTFLRSKAARRIFVMFVACALLPITVLAVISFTQVTQQLREQSRAQLRQASKAHGMSIFDRLKALEAEMVVIASKPGSGGGAIRGAASSAFGADSRDHFNGLTLVTDAGQHETFFGPVRIPLTLTAAERQHIEAGKTVVSSHSCSGGVPCVLMSRQFDPQLPKRGILVGEINSEYLWGADKLPPLTELCVLDQSNRVLFSSITPAPAFPEEVLREMARSTSGQFEWRYRNKAYFAQYWSAFLKPSFSVPKWTVVLSESRGDVLAPLAHFQKTFPPVILLALWVVLLFSLIQIRRNLAPLEALREGTRRIANGDFETRVAIASGDEFQELATSFNTMSSRLGRQFQALTTVSEIDRAILSSWETVQIVETVLARLRDLVPYDGVSIGLLDPSAPDVALTYIGTADSKSGKQVEAITVVPEEVVDLRAHPEGLTIKGCKNLPHYLAPLAERGMKSFLVLPIFLKGNLSAIISLGHPAPSTGNEEDVVHVRQVADQIAIALSNARLIERIEQLHWGTLTALARAIDAKSAWTAGHSERVTQMALKIGRAIGLLGEELEILHRGGLLHDIGKIGTPAAILDKVGDLSEEELRLMREHVRIGARILEPIPGFADVIPIVLQHHEWFDGSGYPDGLTGEAISLHARIFAVADCYDALSSTRPYRPGLDLDRVIQFVKERAGSQFDPKVVEALLEVLAQEGADFQPDAACVAPRAPKAGATVPSMEYRAYKPKV